MKHYLLSKLTVLLLIASILMTPVLALSQDCRGPRRLWTDLWTYLHHPEVGTIGLTLVRVGGVLAWKIMFNNQISGPFPYPPGEILPGVTIESRGMSVRERNWITDRYERRYRRLPSVLICGAWQFVD